MTSDSPVMPNAVSSCSRYQGSPTVPSRSVHIQGRSQDGGASRWGAHPPPHHTRRPRAMGEPLARHNSARRLNIALALALASGLAACRSPSVIADDFGTCQPPTGEFGGSGCVEILGRVLGARNQPLGDVVVGPTATADASQFNTPITSTDGSGRFRLRMRRVAPPPLPDSVTIEVRATVVPNLPQMAATVLDSATVRVAVAPMGQVPVPASVTIVLPVE
jgi:hypothetical protein